MLLYYRRKFKIFSCRENKTMSVNSGNTMIKCFERKRFEMFIYSVYIVDKTIQVTSFDNQPVRIFNSNDALVQNILNNKTHLVTRKCDQTTNVGSQ
jgi:hypothetical protein